MVEANEAQQQALQKSMISLVVTVVIVAALLFGTAGTFNWLRGWWFMAAFIVAMLVSVGILWRTNPEIFVARSRVQAGTKWWDYIFLVLIIGGLAALLPVAGLDYRFAWLQAPDWLVVVGYLLFVLSFAGQIWPQATNRHFEPGVRIQTDRQHSVVDTGPYSLVRHPGYVSGALLAISVALVLGSLVALLPAAIVIAALATRTIIEDRTLQQELPGYADYALRVRYRWVPGVW
ncbi:methyltransferase family protein [Devosia sp. ZW T5_3]|uniref:methyltransferase family protein n=1 Tax=Devosia sp. ZW T5_3 TaxID=3378085 RepID=UPI003854FB12